MKVNAWKTVDIECEVDVSLDDCISEFLGIASEDGMPRRKLQAIDGATRILESIPPSAVSELLASNPRAVDYIRQRLELWITRVSAVGTK